MGPTRLDQTLPDIVLFVRPDDGRILDANAAALAAYGYDRETLLSMTVTDLRPPGMAADVPERLAAAARDGGALFEVLHRRADGSTFVAEVNSNAATIDGVRLLVSITRDVTERRRREAELSQKEARLQLAVHLARLGIWDWEIATDGIEWNDEMLRIYGVERSEFTGRCRDYAAFTRDVHRAAQDENIAAIVERGLKEAELLGPVGVSHAPREVRIVRPDGSERYTLGDALAVVDETGKPVRMLGVTLDISELKRAQLELMESQATLSAIVDSTNDMVWSVDCEHFGLLVFNRGLADYFWMSRGIRIAPGMRPDALLPDKAGADMWNALYDRALREGAFTTEYSTVFGSRTLELSLIPLVRDGKPFGISVFGKDITERKHAEERERRDHERLLSAVETAGLAFYEMVGDEIVYMDGYAAAVVGADGGEDAYRAWHAGVHPDDRARVESLVAELQAGTDRITFEYRFQHPRRGTIWMQHQVRVFERGPDGRVTRRMGVLRDATEQRLAEMERLELQAQLRHAQKMEAIGTLAGGIAHDFNNILTPMMAHADLALLRLPEDDPAREHLTGILQAAERAKELVAQILAINRREDSDAVSTVNLASLVNETSKFLRASIPATIDISTDVDPGCGLVTGSVSQLHQVLLNLCTNAADAMQPNGGLLSVSLVRDEGPAPAAGEPAPEGPGWLRLSVSDTGCGMPAEIVERIFEPYFTTKPRGKGSGLGLSVVHGIVQALGGEVRVRSRAGAGTTFDIFLPESARPEPEMPTDASSLPHGENLRVLVVDDEPAIRAVLASMLETLGYRAVEVENGIEAIALLRRDPDAFDAVLTDFTMPEMTGPELAAELRRLRRGLRVVLSTGFAGTFDETDAARLGVDGLVFKPFTLGKLGAELARAFAGVSAGGGAA